jgi:hypothetical protein
MKQAAIAVLVFVTTAVVLVPGATAQFIDDATDVHAEGAAYKIFARVGEPVIRVHVLSEAGSGLYAVGTSTTLTELLALSGGASVGEGTTEERRTVTVRLYRRGAEGGRAMIYEAELNEMLQEPHRHPSLDEGDVLSVETTYQRRFDMLRTLQVVSGLSTVVLLVLRLTESN